MFIANLYELFVIGSICIDICELFLPKIDNLLNFTGLGVKYSILFHQKSLLLTNIVVLIDLGMFYLGFNVKTM